MVDSNRGYLKNNNKKRLDEKIRPLQPGSKKNVSVTTTRVNSGLYFCTSNEIDER